MAFFDFLKRKKKARTEVETSSSENKAASQEMTDATFAAILEPELAETLKRARELSEKYRMRQEPITCAKTSSAGKKDASEIAPPETRREQSAPKTSPADGQLEQIPKAETAASVQPQDPPEFLWIVTDEIGNPPFETIEGKQYMRLYETPKEAEAAPRMPGRALLCEVFVRRLKATNAFYRKDNGSWLWEKITINPDSIRVEYQYKLYGSQRREIEYLDPLKPNTPWPKAFLDRYVGLRMLLVEPEWFESIRQICREWGVKPGICGNSMVGLNSVEYLWRRGGPPRNKPLFLVCQLSEDDYIFSDTRHFFFAHILNAWEWDSQFDKIGWRVYKKFEYALLRHCFGNGARVPLTYLGMALSSLIRHKRPTFAGTWFMQSREEGCHGIVRLCAKYALRNGTPTGVESLSLCVASGKDDPDVIDRNLISGTDEEIRAWLQQPENQESITTIARQMLKDYEEIYTENRHAPEAP